MKQRGEVTDYGQKRKSTIPSNIHPIHNQSRNSECNEYEKEPGKIDVLRKAEFESKIDLSLRMWARIDSNYRPRSYQDRALTT